MTESTDEVYTEMIMQYSGFQAGKYGQRKNRCTHTNNAQYNCSHTVMPGPRRVRPKAV